MTNVTLLLKDCALGVRVENEKDHEQDRSIDVNLTPSRALCLPINCLAADVLGHFLFLTKLLI